MKREVLNRINEIIDEEKGRPVTINSKVSDSNLDSLALILLVSILEEEYNLEEDFFGEDNFGEKKVSEVVRACVTSFKSSA